MKYANKFSTFFNSTNAKIAAILFIAVVAVHIAVFFGFLYLENSFGDFDGNPGSSFPIIGQDSPGFVLLAHNLAVNRSFSVDGLHSETFRTPGYPFFIFFAQTLFESLNSVVFLQIVCSGIIAVLVWLFAKKLLSPNVAMLASVLFSLSPLMVFHSVVLLSEIPFLLFFLLSLFLIFFTSGGKTAMFFGGVTLGVSALVRPISLYLPILYALFILFGLLRGESLKKVCVSVCLLVVGFSVVVTPWYIRNFNQTGVWGFSSISTYNVAYYNVKDFLVWKFGSKSPELVSYVHAIEQIPPEQAVSLDGGNELQKVFIPYLKDNIFSYLFFHITTTTKFFFSSSIRYIAIHTQIPALQNALGLSGPVPDLLTVLVHREWGLFFRTLGEQSIITIDRIVAITLTLLAACSLFFSKNRFYSILLLSLIFYFAILTGPVSIPRYRLPVEPFILILALFTMSEFSKYFYPIKQRFLYVSILARCFFRALKYGGAKGLPPLPPRAVLIVQLAFLGDMVCTTPLFRAVKKKYPNCRVIVLGARVEKTLLVGHPDVDRYIVWEENFKKLREQLEQERIDFACITTPNLLALAYLYLSGIPAIAVPEIKNGFSPYETKSFRLLCLLSIRIPHRMGSYAPREYLRLLEPIGIFSEDTTKVLSFSAGARDAVDAFLVKVGDKESVMRVVISPSAGNKIKNWPSNRFSAVADFLIEKYNAKVFVIGAESDRKEVEEMVSASRYKNKIINTLNVFSLDELKVLISRMDLFISVDTGPLYIAEAFNVPTIDIIGPIDENEQPPRGELHRWIVSPSRAKPLLHVMNARVYDTALAKQAVDEITPDMVFGAIEDLYPSLSKNKI